MNENANTNENLSINIDEYKENENYDFDSLKKSAINKPRPFSEASNDNNNFLLKKRLWKKTNSSNNNLIIPFITHSHNLEKINSKKNKNTNNDNNNNTTNYGNNLIEKPHIVTKMNDLSKIISINNNISNSQNYVNLKINNNTNNLNINVNNFTNNLPNNDHSPIHLLNLEKYSNNKNSTKYNKRFLKENKNTDSNLDLYTYFQNKNIKNENNSLSVEIESPVIILPTENDSIEKILNNDSLQTNQEETFTSNKKTEIKYDNLIEEVDDNNQDKFINNPILVVEQEVNISNSQLENIQMKVPRLLNTINNLYDMNSERIKKRSQQMKKLKEKFEINDQSNKIFKYGQNDNYNIVINENFTEKETITDQLGLLRKNKYLSSKEKEDHIDNKYNFSRDDYNTNTDINENNNNYLYNFSNNKFMSTKKYQEEPDIFPLNPNCESIDEKTTMPTLLTRYSGMNSDKDKEKALFSGTSNTDADATDNNTNNNDKAAEIVISDLECDLDDINDNIKFKTDISNFTNSSNGNNNNNNLLNSNAETNQNTTSFNNYNYINNNFYNNNNNNYSNNLMQSLGTNLIIPNSLNSNKSFVPINNNLREKNSFSNSKEKATPSYLMALYQYEENDQNEDYMENRLNMHTLRSSQDIYNNSNYNSYDNNMNIYGTFKSKRNKNRNNYRVENVIEEETSENNTDMELSGKKKNSFFHSILNISERHDNRSKEIFLESINNSYSNNNNNNNNSNYFSPYNQHKKSTMTNNNSISNNSNSQIYNNNLNMNMINISVNGNNIFNVNNNNINHNIYNINNNGNFNINSNYDNNTIISNNNYRLTSNSSSIINNKRHSKSENFNKEIFVENISENSDTKVIFDPFHKSSKSELLNIQFDMKNIVDNIHSKHLNNKGEKLEKIKMRKNYLLKTFGKSNSHHDLEKFYNLSHNSNETFNNISSNNNNEIKRNTKFYINSSPKADLTSFNSKKLTPSSISRAKFYDEFFEDIEELDENKQTEQDNNQVVIIDFNENNELNEDQYKINLNKNNLRIRNLDIVKNLNNFIGISSNSNIKTLNFFDNDKDKNEISYNQNTKNKIINVNYNKRRINNKNTFKPCPPRYTLSQEKNKENIIYNSEINNDVTSKKSINVKTNKRYKIDKKRRNNNSHHNFLPKLTIFNKNENLGNYNKNDINEVEENLKLNINYINWENEKESLNEETYNLDKIDKEHNLLNAEIENYKLLKQQEINQRRNNKYDNNDIYISKKSISNTKKNKNKNLKNNIEYENINLVSLISSESEGNFSLEKKNQQGIYSDSRVIHRKLSFIDNIDIEESNIPNNSLLFNNNKANNYNENNIKNSYIFFKTNKKNIKKHDTLIK